MFPSGDRGKQEQPGEQTSQSREEVRTNPTHVWRWDQNQSQATLVQGK